MHLLRRRLVGAHGGRGAARLHPRHHPGPGGQKCENLPAIFLSAIFYAITVSLCTSPYTTHCSAECAACTVVDVQYRYNSTLLPCAHSTHIPAHGVPVSTSSPLNPRCTWCTCRREGVLACVHPLLLTPSKNVAVDTQLPLPPSSFLRPAGARGVHLCTRRTEKRPSCRVPSTNFTSTIAS